MRILNYLSYLILLPFVWMGSSSVSMWITSPWYYNDLSSPNVLIDIFVFLLSSPFFFIKMLIIFRVIYWLKNLSLAPPKQYDNLFFIIGLMASISMLLVKTFGEMKFLGLTIPLDALSCLIASILILAIETPNFYSSFCLMVQANPLSLNRLFSTNFQFLIRSLSYVLLLIFIGISYIHYEIISDLYIASLFQDEDTIQNLTGYSTPFLINLITPILANIFNDIFKALIIFRVISWLKNRSLAAPKQYSIYFFIPSCTILFCSLLLFFSFNRLNGGQNNMSVLNIDKFTFLRYVSICLILFVELRSFYSLVPKNSNANNR